MCSFLDVTAALFAACIQATTYGGGDLAPENPFETEAFQSGMNLYLTEEDYTASENFVWSSQLFLDSMEKVGVNTISVVWPIFTEGLRSNRVFAGTETPSEEALATFVAVAKARGFGVVLHPTLDERVLPLKEWRGTIRPLSVDAWFQSYTEIMHKYAIMAESVDVDLFVVGAELQSMERYSRHWQKLVADVRTVFSGQVTYASNREISETFPWEVVDLIGVDAFFALDVPVGSSVEEMTASLRLQQDELLDTARALGQPLVFTEIGTTSQRGSFLRTWVWNHRTLVDQEAQADYYAAVCNVWRRELDGLYWWVTHLHPIEEELLPRDTSFDPIGKPAEAIVRDCFTDK